MTLRSEASEPSDGSSGRNVVLVSGGRGFVGSHITRHLISAGYYPHLFGPSMEDDLLADLAGSFGETHGSVEDRGAIARALEESGAHTVISTAAHSVGRGGLMRSSDAQSDKALAVNVLGFRNLLEASREAGVERTVWTSSTVVYGSADDYPDQPVNEDAPCGPLTFYGLTKQLSEDVAAFYRNRHDMNIVGLRLPLVLGKGLWYQGAASAITKLIAAAAEGRAHCASLQDDPIDLMHVVDVANAALAVLGAEGPFDAIYNINGFTARPADYLSALSRRFGKVDITFEPQEQALRFPLISDKRFRDHFAFTPAFGLEDAIGSILEKESFDD